MERVLPRPKNMRPPPFIVIGAESFRRSVLSVSVPLELLIFSEEKLRVTEEVLSRLPPSVKVTPLRPLVTDRPPPLIRVIP